MNYTPYSTFTDEELLVEATCKADPTDLEIELMQRLERALAELEHLPTPRKMDLQQFI